MQFRKSAEAITKTLLTLPLLALIAPLPAWADMMPLSVGNLFEDKVLNSNTRECWYRDDGPTSGSAVHSFHFPLNARCPTKVPLHENATLDPLPGMPDLLTPGQKNHICGYYIDNDRLGSWHLRHPNDPNPLFEAVVPVTTECPNPPDDSTPIDDETPAQRALIYRKRLIIDCDNEKSRVLNTLQNKGSAANAKASPEMTDIETSYRACLSGSALLTTYVADTIIDELKELHYSRHLLGGGVVTTERKGIEDCGRVESYVYFLNVEYPDHMSKRADQRLCISRGTRAIYVQESGEAPVLLDEWKQAHPGITSYGNVVIPFPRE